MNMKLLSFAAAALVASISPPAVTIDLDALVGYVESLPQPFSAAIEGRIERVN